MKQFYIPQYVKDILSRSQFAVDSGRFMDDDDPGYTIIIPKHSIYAQADTLQAEVKRLADWAMRVKYGVFPTYGDMQFPPVVVREMPTETHYRRQYAVLDIYDPIMLRVEHLIPRINK